jgi:hypothetical protein
MDVSFAVHNDFKSHTGGVMTLGAGAIQMISTKQRLNTKSSTEAELVLLDDFLLKVMLTKLCLKAQRYDIKENNIHRDNQGTMKTEMHGKISLINRTGHINM